LERLPGVHKVVVSFQKAQAVVQYDPIRVTVEEMIQAVKKAGFTATLAPSPSSGRR